MGKLFLNALRGAIAALVCVIAAGASAQSATPPAGLQWQWMHEFNFNTNNFPDTGTLEEKSLLAKIWEKEINSTISTTNGSLMLSTALMGSVEYNGTKVILTMFDSANSDCIQPGNGRSMHDMYGTCALRLIRFLPDGKSNVQDLPTQFCMLDVDSPNNPRSKNHNEYAFDQRTGIVYLRVIQYGKVVLACNRALRIFKVQ
ncbi:MAG: hypothetical protein LBV49_04195 [Azonexus sp.]|jgi:hypothetical protein|nr:hypothetical protein [Azonexus sp.]